MKNSKRHSRIASRKGNALVELVFGIPILFLLTFGSIEACNLNHLQQNAVQVSYQGALTAMSPMGNEVNVEARMTDMLDAYGLTGGTVEVVGVDGTPFNDLNSGERFIVRTIIPSSENLPMLAVFVDIADVQSEQVAVKP